MTETTRTHLIPALAPVYAKLDCVAWAIFRVTAGLALVTHGWPKIQDPMSRIGMVEGLGFHPGVVFAPLLAATEFLGGLLIAVGLLTRPAAVAATFVLLVTVYFHWVLKGEGWKGAELSVIWSAAMFLIAVRGGGALSVDRRIGREF